MFQVKDNKEIGSYFSKLIDHNFNSKRQFCKAYIENTGGIINDEEIRKMANRISQIIKGKKSIQTYDLPIVTKLLGVSCEQILSAGEYFVPEINRLTNYSIAFIKDEYIWEQYINRDDKLILNSDEYGKTVLDYAFEFKNFELLQYLMEKKYIWFVDFENNDYFCNFRAGTSIKRRPPEKIDDLPCKLAENDRLRMRMISLAIDHDNIKMLTELRAREIPALYQACYYTFTTADCERYYDADMVIHLANASEQILDYFSKEFEIQAHIKYTNTFMFPYLTNLIDLLINSNSSRLEMVLRKAIAHNQQTYKTLKSLISNTFNELTSNLLGGPNSNLRNSYAEEYFNRVKNDIKKGVMEQFVFYDNGNIVCFRDAAARKGIITNVIRANKKSNDNRINSLIKELNTLYDDIRNIKL